MKLRANLSAMAFAIFTSAASCADLQNVDADVFSARARGAVDAYLELWGTNPAARMMQAFEEDAVLEYTHAIPELHAQVAGRQSMITQVQVVAQLGEDWKFTQPELYPTLYKNIYYAAYVASAKLKATGERFERKVIIRVELGPEKASRLTEFANPAIAQSADTIQASSITGRPEESAASVAPPDICSEQRS